MYTVCCTNEKLPILSGLTVLFLLCAESRDQTSHQAAPSMCHFHEMDSIAYLLFFSLAPKQFSFFALYFEKCWTKKSQKSFWRKRYWVGVRVSRLKYTIQKACGDIIARICWKKPQGTASVVQGHLQCVSTTGWAVVVPAARQIVYERVVKQSAVSNGCKNSKQIPKCCCVRIWMWQCACRQVICSL